MTRADDHTLIAKSPHRQESNTLLVGRTMRAVAFYPVGAFTVADNATLTDTYLVSTRISIFIHGYVRGTAIVCDALFHALAVFFSLAMWYAFQLEQQRWGGGLAVGDQQAQQAQQQLQQGQLQGEQGTPPTFSISSSLTFNVFDLLFALETWRSLARLARVVYRARRLDPAARDEAMRHLPDRWAHVGCGDRCPICLGSLSLDGGGSGVGSGGGGGGGGGVDGGGENDTKENNCDNDDEDDDDDARTRPGAWPIKCLPCKHLLHSDCLRELLKRAQMRRAGQPLCPLCRAPCLQHASSKALFEADFVE